MEIFDNVFLLSLSPWLVDLGKQYLIQDLNQREDCWSVSLQILKTAGWKTLKEMWKFIRETIYPIIQSSKGGPRGKAYLH